MLRLTTSSPANAKRMSRLGIILSSVGVLAIILVGGQAGDLLQDGNLVYPGILALQTIIGLGLLFGSRLARIGAMALFAFLAGASLWHCGEMLIEFVPAFDGRVDYALWLANAVATTTLLVWLSFRAIQIVLDTLPTQSLATPRLLGAVLIIVAFSHLKLALAYGFASSTSFSISISPLGSNLSGFFGWGVWHAAALAIGIALMMPWQRLVSMASLFLLILVGLLCPATVITLLRFSAGDIVSWDWSFLAVSAAQPLLLAYLSWWLAREQGLTLKSMSRRQWVGALALLAIALAAAVAVEAGQQDPMAQQREEVAALIANAEAEEFEAEVETNSSAAPLNEAIIPFLKVWYCGSASMERGNCDFYLENCEQANTEPCYEQLSAWCFTYRSEELRPEDFACYSTESICISFRYQGASRCEPYPSQQRDPEDASPT